MSPPPGAEPITPIPAPSGLVYEALKPGRDVAERFIAAIPTTRQRAMGSEDAKDGIRSSG
jgi:hypothetical protein